jgi:Phospholipase_D-nuclease N-terminal
VRAGVPVAALIAASAGSSRIPVAAVLPLVVLGVAFVAYCLVDLARHDVRYLPKWAWALICLVSIPVGGIVYLIVGRDHR